jgi:hypothetical protein
VTTINDEEFQEMPPRETAWQAIDRVTEYRKLLLRCGYPPVPCIGKRVTLEKWQHMRPTEHFIETWAKTLPDHLNTGVLNRDVPFVDVDVASAEVADAITALLETDIEQSAVRVGCPPKRAIPFRTDTPFDKMEIKFTSPNGTVHGVEIRCDGQQTVVDGIHPGTKQPYRWHGGAIGPKLRRGDLPVMTKEKAQKFLADAAAVMRAHGWTEFKDTKKRKANGADREGATYSGPVTERERRYASAALDGLADELAAAPAGTRNNKLYSASFRVATMVARTWIARAKAEAALFDAARDCGLIAADGERQTRATIDSGISSGMKVPHADLHDDGAPAPAPAPPEQYPPCALDEVHAVFRKWLGNEYDMDAANAAIAAAASERLPGDPLWLLIVAGPGGAKTETVQALAGAGAHVTSTIASEGALLSATPRRERNKGATGGLLRKLGDRGVLVIKDVTSILSADRNVRGSVLAAIREIYDGRWERNVGTDGGQTLTWTGRVVVVGACTTAWDAAHSVVAAMGDRFVLLRPKSGSGRIKAGLGAIRNTGGETAMRQELATAVGGVVAHMDTSGHELSDGEVDQLLKAADIVTMARSAVERDYRGEIMFAHDPEMPTRFAKQLVQLLRGAIAIGMTAAAAMRLAMRCAADSIPPLRRDILLDLANHPGSQASDVRKRISKPRNTVRRELECMHMLGLLRCVETEDLAYDGKKITRWHYHLADDYDEPTLRAMAGCPEM